MPEDNTIESELREIAKQEADKNRVVSVDNLPDVQKVDVQNWPEQKEPVVNVNVPDVVVPEFPKIPAPIVNVEAPEVTIETDLSELKIISKQRIILRVNDDTTGVDRFDAIAYGFTRSRD